MSEKEIELESDLAVINVPSNATEMIILFKGVVNDEVNGESLDVFQTYSEEELEEAKNYAKENLFSDDDTFVLTNKGLEYLESLHS